MQIVPSTGAQLCAPAAHPALLDAMLTDRRRTCGSAPRYFARSRRSLRRRPYALASYNAGAGAVARWMAERPGHRRRRIHRRHPVSGDAELRAEDPRHRGRLPPRSTASSASSRWRAPPAIGERLTRRSEPRRSRRRRSSPAEAAIARASEEDAPRHKSVTTDADQSGRRPRATMLRPRGSKKATQFTESVIREMTRLAQQHGAVNLSQGFPDFPAPEAIKDAACAAIQRRHQPVRRSPGAREKLREAIAARVHAPLRRAGRRRRAGDRLLRLHRGDDGDAAGHRWIRATRSIVFEPFYENYGPDAIVSGAVPRFVTLHEPDWTFDPRRARRGVQRPRTRAIIINTPEQPDGQGLHARGAASHRAALPAVGRAGHHRRDLRAHRLRRPPARADGVDRRHGRSHGHDQRPVEDVQRDRLARGLGDLAAGADGRDPQGARLPDRRGAGAAAAGGRRGAGAAGAATTPSSPPTTAAGATCWSRSSRATASAASCRHGAYYVMTDIAALRLSRRCRVRAASGGAGRRRGGAGQQLLPRRGPRPHEAAFLLLEARRDDGRGRPQAHEAQGLTAPDRAQCWVLSARVRCLVLGARCVRDYSGAIVRPDRLAACVSVRARGASTPRTSSGRR